MDVVEGRCTVSVLVNRINDMPRAALGQHFLINRRILSKILTAADLSESDIVLEIGPGKGFLTKPLLTRVKKVVAIEIDEGLLGSQIGLSKESHYSK